MNRYFGDTSYFVASLFKNDAAHLRAVNLAKSLRGTIVTTEWVLVELGNFFATTSYRQMFCQFINRINNSSQIVVLPPEEALFDEGFQLYQARKDKFWSLTDCISMEVMRREEITDALTADHHFTQAGFNALLLK